MSNISLANETISKDLILTKDSLAPFTGVLVPENNYREYSKALRISQEVKDCPLCPECPVSEPCKPECGFMDKITWTAGGFVLGVTSAVIISILKR